MKKRLIMPIPLILDKLHFYPNLKNYDFAPGSETELSSQDFHNPFVSSRNHLRVVLFTKLEPLQGSIDFLKAPYHYSVF